MNVSIHRVQKVTVYPSPIQLSRGGSWTGTIVITDDTGTDHEIILFAKDSSYLYLQTRDE